MPITPPHRAEFGVGDVANLVVREVKTIVLDCRARCAAATTRPTHASDVFVPAAGLAQNIDGEYPSDGGGSPTNSRAPAKLCQSGGDDCVHARWQISRREPRYREVVFCSRSFAVGSPRPALAISTTNSGFPSVSRYSRNAD